MQCPRCQQDNPTRQKFCGECGTPLQHSSVALTSDRTPLSLFLPESPIERLSPEDDEDAALESTGRFERQRSGKLVPKLLGVLSGVALAALGLSLVGQHIEQSLGQRERSQPSEVTGTASLEPGTTSQEASTSPRKTATPPRGASTPVTETGAPPRAGTREGASGSRPRLSAAVRPSLAAPAPFNQLASAPSPEATMPKATHAELVRQPVSRGWGDSYAVRLLDSAGRPLVIAEALLVARMADGTVEYIAMGALPEPGTYRGTVPTGRSTPVDLRVRVSTGDKFVEIPVRP
jgi:hypothetical protein